MTHKELDGLALQILRNAADNLNKRGYNVDEIFDRALEIEREISGVVSIPKLEPLDIQIKQLSPIREA